MRLNKLFIVGNIGQDPEIKTLENKTKLAVFTIAENDGYYDKKGEWVEQTQWHTVKAWRGQAEKVESKFSKGDTVHIEGRIKNEQWEDKNGNKRTTSVIIPDSIQLIPKHQKDSK